jgi:hypothetical protein
LYGKDKIPFSERIAWVNSEIENIWDSAVNPLTGKKWWLHADEPWQVRILLNLFSYRSAWQLALKSRKPLKVLILRSTFVTYQSIKMVLAMDYNIMQLLEEMLWEPNL